MRSRSLGVVVAAMLLLGGCHDVATEPRQKMMAAPGTSAKEIDANSTTSAEFVVGFEAPLNGKDTTLGHYAYSTLVAMTVHQHFSITVLSPFPPGAGELGLAGRMSALVGCSGQGMAYLMYFNDAGGYGYAFNGCQFASDPLRATYSDTVAVVGTVHYGYGWDAACPYPDYGCAAYSGSSGVQLSPLHATLSLTSDELHDGELWVWPGMEYDVRAVASPSQMGRFQVPILPTGSGWTFTPDSGAAQGDFCTDGGDRFCTVASNKSGYLRLTALVNAEQMETAPLRLVTPKVTVALSDTSLRVGDTLVLTTSLRGADASILTGYYAGYTASLTQGTQPEGLTSTSSSQGLPPCLGTQPVPLHCYIVITAPGRALVGVSAKIGRTYFGDYKYVTVRSAARLHVAIVPSSRTMLEFSRHIHAKGCKSTDDVSTRKLHVFVIDSGTATPVKLANKVINLELAPVIPADPMTPDAGGHVVSVHVGNPKPSGSLNAIEVTTDANGDAYVTYTAPEFAGKYEVRAISQGAAPAADTVTVGIVLQQLVAGAHFGLVGQTTAHPSNHFGTPKMNAQLVEFADETYDMLGVSVEFNDMSLPLGGRFEVKDTNDPVLAWSNLAHCDHREGQGTDLRTNPFMDAKTDTKEKPSIVVQNMMSSWKTLNPDWKDPKHLPYFWEGDHLHLKVKP